MNRDVNNHLQVDDKEYWTLVGMMNKYRDEERDKLHSGQSRKVNRLKPRFR